MTLTSYTVLEYLDDIIIDKKIFSADGIQDTNTNLRFK
jgi:hypothetical protein